jgi:hypothetical protein
VIAADALFGDCRRRKPRVFGFRANHRLVGDWRTSTHRMIARVSVPGHSLHVPRGGGGLGWGLRLVFAVVSEYLSRSRGRGNVVIPKGSPRRVGRVETRPLGFPCFPYSVISMPAFGNAYHKITVTAKALVWSVSYSAERTRTAAARSRERCRFFEAALVRRTKSPAEPFVTCNRAPGVMP